MMNKIYKLFSISVAGLFFFCLMPNLHAEHFEPQLENQRNPNETCASCHRFQTDGTQSGGDLHFGKFDGIHLTKLSPNSGKPITCESCHGKISEDHRKGVKDVMRYQENVLVDTPPTFSVEEQNQVCFACHQPSEMREKLWAHDVHAMTVSCVSCHKVHPAKEPMKGIEKKAQVKLCVDCHKKQADAKANKKE